MRLRLKHILYALFMLALWAPFLQSEFQLIDEVKLGGDVRNTATNPTLNRNAWFSGQFQSEKADFIQQSLGFRNSLIKLNNQIAYTVFNYAKAKGVIVGKSGFLFEEGYIKSYLGIDRVSDSVHQSQVYKIKALQDTLAKKGVDLVIALTLGKGAFYPEFIPDSYGKKRGSNNYDILSKKLIDSKVNFLDLYNLMLVMKDTSRFPLFPKNGTHWSKYAEILIADTMARYISNLKGVDLPWIKINELELTNKARGTDNDIEEGLNLIFKLSNLKMAYPKFEVVENNSTFKPKAIVIGDSFYWGFYHYGFPKTVFNNSSFWYYNKQVYAEGKEVSEVKYERLKESVESKDLILILTTESHFGQVGFGFIEQLYEVYFEPDIYKRKLAIEEVKKQILNNQEWYESLKKVASEQGRPLEVVIEENAIYMVNVNSEKNK